MNGTYFLVEQAVFSANLARRSASGRNEAALLCATSGASRDDLDAALDWASRVETFDGGYDPRNLFFFPTPSGAFAIGRLTPAAPEAGKGAFYFQTFFVEEDAFFQCGANPVALLHLALNTARFALYRPGAALEAFRLEARAPWIDQDELRRTTERLGARALTTLIQTALESRRSIFVADYSAFLVVAALFELTPMHWRPELTFAVGVRFRDDVSLRLLGATARRGVEEPIVESGTPCCDLRDVVENDDAYPIENAWAALVELALKANRVDYLYERMAEDFFLYQKNDDGGERRASSEEIAELGLRWRLGLENAIRGKEENDGADAFDDEATDDGEEAAERGADDRTEDAETFFDGEFEGGWRDSDGDERWRLDEADAAETRPARSDRVAPEFIFKVVEPSDRDPSVEPADERKNGREKKESLKRNDNNDNDGGARRSWEAPRRRGAARAPEDIFAGESFAEEWAATVERRDGRGEDGGEDGSNVDGERGEPGPEDEKSGARRGESSDESERDDRGEEDEQEERWEKEEALEALRRVFAGENGVAGADGARRTAIAGRFEEFLQFLKVERAFDEPLGLDGLASLSALLDERGEEALERLKRAARRSEDGGRSDAERRGAEPDARLLRLSPFAALSAEYPGWNEELRRFNALFNDVCSGNDAAAEELREFWRGWRPELEDETVDRIRTAYEERLRGRWTSEDGDSVARTDRLLAALAIYGALFLER